MHWQKAGRAGTAPNGATNRPHKKRSISRSETRLRMYMKKYDIPNRADAAKYMHAEKHQPKSLPLCIDSKHSTYCVSFTRLEANCQGLNLTKQAKQRTKRQKEQERRDKNKDFEQKQANNLKGFPSVGIGTDQSAGVWKTL